MYGKTHSEETKLKISENHVNVAGKNHPMYGKTHSEEAKRNMRLAAIHRIEQTRGQLIPNYNPEACKFIDEYGKQHGFNFQHAENGGEFHITELGYWVDGYDVEQNVVIEMDESYHYQNGNLRERDTRRQREIEEHLGCKFIRIVTA